MATQVSKQLT